MLNQPTRIAALPGISGLIGASLAGGGLFSVAGGNAALVEGSLRLADAEVRTGTRVVEVLDDRTLVLDDGTTVAADIVVLALPLAVAGITLPESVALPPTRYRHVHVTLVAGSPSPQYFGTKTPPQTVFTTWNDDTPFTSLGRIGYSRGEGVPIYKFFSLEPLTDETVRRVMHDVRAIDRLEWDAYPVMEVSPQTAPFELAAGVYFPNALEPMISTLETETIAGRAVGALVAERLRRSRA
jgi:prenylcysteine oxidase/farnesylcysteine lyase